VVPKRPVASPREPAARSAPTPAPNATPEISAAGIESLPTAPVISSAG
jgi:hypothetical protein